MWVVIQNFKRYCFWYRHSLFPIFIEPQLPLVVHFHGFTMGLYIFIAKNSITEYEYENLSLKNSQAPSLGSKGNGTFLPVEPQSDRFLGG